MRTILAALAAAALWSAAAAFAQDYPYEQFEKIQQCLSDPSCQQAQEDRVTGAVAEAEGITYSGVCIRGCRTLCTQEACWCEVDDKCKRR